MIDRVRVLILSDTHGDLAAPIAGLSAAVDYVLHCGDIGDTHVLSALQPRERVLVITGNNDTPSRAAPQDLSVLSGLAETTSLELPGGTLVGIHGHRQVPARRRHSALRKLFPQARCIAYGHSHRLVIDREDSPWVVNPGAAGRDRTHGGPACLLLDATAARWQLSAHRFPLAPLRRRALSRR